jgi:YVTN family beta-propeller protein
LQFNIWGVNYSIPLWDDAHPWSVWGLPWQRSTTFTVANYSGSRLTWIMYQPYYHKQNGGAVYTYPGGHAGEDFTMYVWTDCGRVQLQGVIDDPTPTPGAPAGLPHRIWAPMITNAGVSAANPVPTVPPAPPTATPIPPTVTPVPPTATRVPPAATPLPARVIVGGLNTPNDVAYNPNTGRIYISNRDSNSVQVVDAGTYQTLARIPVCAQPFGLDVQVNANKVYVACFGSHQVAVIDGASQQVKKVIEVGESPTYVAVNQRTHRVYVVSHGDNELEEIDSGSDRLVRRIGVSGGAFGLAVNVGQNRVYVGSREHNDIMVVDATAWRVLRSYRANEGSAAGSVYALAYNEYNYRLYVTYRGPGFGTKLGVFRATEAGLQRLATASLPDGGEDASGRIGINARTGHVFIPNMKSQSVSVLDAPSNRVLSNISVALGPFGVAVNTRDDRMYVGAKSSSQLWVLQDGN